MHKFHYLSLQNNIFSLHINRQTPGIILSTNCVVYKITRSGCVPETRFESAPENIVVHADIRGRGGQTDLEWLPPSRLD